jgi:hypothetical protein
MLPFLLLLTAVAVMAIHRSEAGNKQVNSADLRKKDSRARDSARELTDNVVATRALYSARL